MKRSLSPRQAEIMRMLCRGIIAKEIAVSKGISHTTVRAHIRVAIRRLQARNIIQAAVLFTTAGYRQK